MRTGFMGKASFLLNDSSEAEAAYRRATSINAEGMMAWKGLAEVYSSDTSDTCAQRIEIHQQLVSINMQHACVACPLVPAVAPRWQEKVPDLAGGLQAVLIPLDCKSGIIGQ